MKKPLNIIDHLKSNIKGILPTILTLGLEFAALVFMIAIGVGVLESVEYNVGSYLYKAGSIQEIDEYNVDEIRDIDEVYKIIPGNLEVASGMLPIANISVMHVKVDVEDMDYIMKHFEAELLEGRLPEKDGEIVLTDYGANVTNAKIGDYAGSAYNDVLSLNSNYKVVGIIKSKYNFYLSYTNNKDKSIILIKDNKGKDLSENLKEHYNTNKEVIGYEGLLEFKEGMGKMLSGLGALVIGLFSLGIWMSSINLTKANLKKLIGEYRILRLLGYKKSFIRKRVYAQLLIIMLIAAMVGIGIGGLVNILFNNLYCIPRGIAYSEFNMYIVIIPIAVSIVLFILSSISTRRIVNNISFNEDI